MRVSRPDTHFVHSTSQLSSFSLGKGPSTPPHSHNHPFNIIPAENSALKRGASFLEAQISFKHFSSTTDWEILHLGQERSHSSVQKQSNKFFAATNVSFAQPSSTETLEYFSASGEILPHELGDRESVLDNREGVPRRVDESTQIQEDVYYVRFPFVGLERIEDVVQFYGLEFPEALTQHCAILIHRPQEAASFLNIQPPSLRNLLT